MKVNRGYKEQKRRQRAEKHGCDGVCYGKDGMCGAIEWCDETRNGELMASVIAAMFVGLLMIMFIPGFLVMQIGDWIFRKIGRMD